MEWLTAMFKRGPDAADAATRETLDAQQKSIAGRLAKLSGIDRDEVLNEAYRRARLQEEDGSYRNAK